MPGFAFRYRRGGGEPTVRTLVFRNTERLTQGDMVNVDHDAAARAVAGDKALLGAALETLDGRAGTTSIRVISDDDAVYGVEDPNARAKGEWLTLTGTTGAQGVAGSTTEFRVERDSRADEETLVAILPSARQGADLDAALARAVTRAYRETSGRGPTRTQAFHRGDVLVVVLEGLITTAERSLLEHGREGAVHDLRTAFQDTMQATIVPVVEELTGTRVRAFMSANHIEADMAIETFVLDAPVGPKP